MRFDSIHRDAKTGRIDFRIREVPLCIVNAIRRAILADVPSAAFAFDICIPDAPGTGIRVISNTTTLNNEMLAHRLSFVPIHLTENEQERFRIDPARYKFSLRVRNKGAASAAVMDVTSHDIHVMDAFGAALQESIRDAMFPPDPITGDHVILVCLRPSPIGDGLGEEVAIDAVASSSSGSVSCRWCPVSLCTFRNVIDGKLADDAYVKQKQKHAEMSDVAPAQSRAQFDTLDAHRCFAKDEHGDPFMFDFSIESVCGLSPEYIFFKALRILAARVALIADALITAGPGTPPVTVEAVPNVDDFYAMTVAGEGHTLGNLVQGLLYEKHVRDENSQRLTFVGYHVAHPLDQSICMKLKVVPGIVIRDFLVEALRGIVARLDSVALEWTHPSSLDAAGITDVDAFLTNIPVLSVQAQKTEKGKDE